MKHFLASLLLVFIASHLLAADKEAEAETTFNELFGKAFDAAMQSADHDDNIKLAESIVDALKEVEGEIPLKAHAYLKVIDLTKSHADSQEFALETAETLGKLGKPYAIKAEAAKLDVYRAMFKATRITKDKAEIADTLAGLLITNAANLLRQGESDKAMAAYRELRTLIRFTDVVTGRQVSDLIRDAQAAVNLNKKFDELQEKLLKDPTDTPTAVELTKLLLVERDDPKAAAKYAPFTKDETLQKVVNNANAEFESLTPDQHFESGQWYWAQFKEASTIAKPTIAQLAHDHLKTFEEKYETAGIKKLKARVTLKNIEKEKAKLADTGKPVASRRASKIPKEAVKFGKSHYLHVDEKVDWKTAVEKAKKMGGQLVCVETAAEAEFIFTKFKDSNRAWAGASNTTGKEMWINKKPFDRKIWNRISWNGGPNVAQSFWFERKELNDFKLDGQFAYIVEWE